jgi:hypothetical protein
VQDVSRYPRCELELVDYIKGLSKRVMPSTRELMQRFASEIGIYYIRNGWVGRFLRRNKHHLTFHWTKGMDAVRYKADSEASHKLYFDLLHLKMEEHGFTIGVFGKSKRIFSKVSLGSKEARIPIIVSDCDAT